MTDRRITVQWTRTTTETYRETFLFDKLPEDFRSAVEPAPFTPALDDMPDGFAEFLILREAPGITRVAVETDPRYIDYIIWSQS